MICDLFNKNTLDNILLIDSITPFARYSSTMAAADISTFDASMASHPLFKPRDAYEEPLIGASIVPKQLFTETVQEIESSRSSSATRSNSNSVPGLFITGLGSQYPPFLFHPDKLEGFIEKFYDLETPG